MGGEDKENLGWRVANDYENSEGIGSINNISGVGRKHGKIGEETVWRHQRGNNGRGLTAPLTARC